MLLFSKSEGAGTRTLVILHGLLGSSENWRTVQRALASEFRVICLDSANHGQSPSAPRFTLETLSMDVWETLDSLGVKRFCLLGHSMGGKIAMRMASDRPERVERLIVVDVTPKALRPSHLFILKACQNLGLQKATTRAELDAELALCVLQPETRAFLLKNVARDEQGRFYWRVPLENLIANYEAISADVEMEKPYAGPLLMMVGGKSPFHVLRHEAELRALFTGISFEVFPGAGHLLHSEEPQRFVEAVRGFLS